MEGRRLENDSTTSCLAASLAAAASTQFTQVLCWLANFLLAFSHEWEFQMPLKELVFNELKSGFHTSKHGSCCADYIFTCISQATLTFTNPWLGTALAF